MEKEAFSLARDSRLLRPASWSSQCLSIPCVYYACVTPTCHTLAREGQVADKDRAGSFGVFFFS